jgi:hypothetical protein
MPDPVGLKALAGKCDSENPNEKATYRLTVGGVKKTFRLIRHYFMKRRDEECLILDLTKEVQCNIVL